MEDNQEAQNAKRGSIPASAMLNFAALFILFMAILALQHYGRKLGPSAQKADEPPAVAVEEAVPLAKPPAPAEAPIPEAHVAVTETAAPETEISEIELPTPPKPKAVLLRAKPVELNTVNRSNPQTEREITVEMLDNEGSRQTYLAANRGLPVPKENPLPIQNAREFIPFEK